MGADMVDIEHGTVKGETVGGNPGGDGGVDVAHLLIGALAGGAGHGYLRQCAEPNVFCIVVCAFYILLHLHIHLVFQYPVQKNTQIEIVEGGKRAAFGISMRRYL